VVVHAQENARLQPRVLAPSYGVRAPHTENALHSGCISSGACSEKIVPLQWHFFLSFWFESVWTQDVRALSVGISAPLFETAFV